MLVLIKFLGIAALAAVGFFCSFKLGLWNPSLETLTAKYAPAPSQFITIDGVPLHVRDEGNTDSALAPLILLNGHLGNLRMWDGWVAALKPHMRVACQALTRPVFTLPIVRSCYWVVSWIIWVCRL